MSDNRRSMSDSVPEDVQSDVDRLENHDYVYNVHDVSVGEHTVLSVQFNTVVLPNALRKSQRYRIGDVWVGTYPSWWLRKFGSRFALRHGIGSPAIAAEVWVLDE